MSKTIGIHGTLTKNGQPDIDLLVHPHYSDGSVSPCVFWTNFVSKTIGGTWDSLDHAFDFEAAKHKGYTVQKRVHLEQKTGP